MGELVQGRAAPDVTRSDGGAGAEIRGCHLIVEDRAVAGEMRISVASGGVGKCRNQLDWVHAGDEGVGCQEKLFIWARKKG